MPSKVPNKGDSSPLERAKKVSDRLQQATETLNGSLRQAEEVLIQLKLGVRASVEMLLDGEILFGPRTRYLTFCKHNDKWGLFVETVREDEILDGDPLPLLNCSRAVRLGAVELLPSLFDQLIDAAEHEIANVEQKAVSAQDFVIGVLQGRSS
jgi:hypothetical protein